MRPSRFASAAARRRAVHQRIIATLPYERDLERMVRGAVAAVSNRVRIEDALIEQVLYVEPVPVGSSIDVSSQVAPNAP
jgi:hypothetical protein